MVHGGRCGKAERSTHAVGREFRTTWGGEPWRIVGIVEDYTVDAPGEARIQWIRSQ